MGDERLLLKPEEVADVLSVSRTRVYELLAEKALPSILIGRTRRVPRHALEEYVAGLEAEEAP
jgi:excisionase family DNA binding protein